MSVARYFIPYCIKPLYLIDTQEQAGKCGFVNGIIYSLFFTLVLLAIITRLYFLDTITEKQKSSILKILTILLVSLLFVIPLICNIAYKTLWKGYDSAKKELQTRGYSKMEILNILQLFEQRAASLNISPISGVSFRKSRGDLSEEDKKNEKITY